MSLRTRSVHYLDHAATTPVAAVVLEAMLPYFTTDFGNPSSLHGPGRRAAVALETARRTLAGFLNAHPGELLFTSGGTEGNNAALRGIALARRAQTGARRIVTTAVEHKAVLSTAEELRDRYGFELVVVPVDGEGTVAVDAVAAAVGNGEEVALVSIMVANNEVGTIQPVAEVGTLCRACGVPVHTDAVQAAGKLPLDITQLQVDALTLTAHKIYGPKGAGLLYLRRGTPFWPLITGGGQEAGRRGGTENVPLIVGLAAAMTLVESERVQANLRLCTLRDRLIDGLLASVDGIRLTGPRQQRLPNHASFVVPGAEAEGMLIALDLAGIAASSGSACTSGAQRPSHVLEAMGITHPAAAGALRFSLGRDTTDADIDAALAALPGIVGRVMR